MSEKLCLPAWTALLLSIYTKVEEVKEALEDKIVRDQHLFEQGYINRGTCSYPELTMCHVLTSAYVIIF